MLSGEMSNFLLPIRRDGKNVGESFKWRSACTKMPQINAFSRNMNPINLKIFPHLVEYKHLSENSTTILERDRAPANLQKNERMYS